MALPGKPLSRTEDFLSKIAGQDTDLPAPRSREEFYLAKMAGEDVELPEKPRSRVEEYLDYIIENGIGTGGYSLIGSGSYTKADNSDPLMIPVTYSGTPKIIAVRVDVPQLSPGTSQAIAFVKRNDSVNQEMRDLFTLGELVYCVETAGSRQYSYLSDKGNRVMLTGPNDNTILAFKVDSGFPWRPNVYDWYIYGIPEA